MKPLALLGLLVLLAPMVAAQAVDTPWGEVAGWFAGLGIIGVIIAILAFVFWVWMLVDAIMRTFKSDVEKVIWILVIIFLNLLGAIIYYFAVRLPGGRLAATRRTRT